MVEHFISRNSRRLPSPLSKEVSALEKTCTGCPVVNGPSRARRLSVYLSPPAFDCYSYSFRSTQAHCIDDMYLAACSPPALNITSNPFVM